MTVIPLEFGDFKNICDEFSKRVYYFQNTDRLDLYFITEGLLVWTFVDLTNIENKETFFGQNMFAGAIKLLFKIPVSNESITSLLRPTHTIVDAFTPEENKPESDIQKDGAKAVDEVY